MPQLQKRLDAWTAFGAPRSYSALGRTNSILLWNEKKPKLRELRERNRPFVVPRESGASGREFQMPQKRLIPVSCRPLGRFGGWNVHNCSATFRRFVPVASRVSIDVLTAVHKDLRRGKVGGVLAAQKEDCARDIFRFAEPVERNARQQQGSLGRQHCGLDLAGSNGIDPDPEPGEFDGH